MTVRCPQCETTYRAPARAQVGDRSTFRCSRCEHVFDPDEAEIEPAVRDDVEPDAALEAAPDSVQTDTSDDGDDAGPRRFAVRTLVAVTVSFALLSIYLFTHATRVSALLSQIPMIGLEIAANRLSPAEVQLTDVRGAYTRIQGDALVFVVTGTAVNNAPVPVSAIEIQARILGGHEQQRLVFAGAAPHDVRDLSEREIDLLQTLRPPRDWRLLPGQDGDFLVAFVDPPLPLREFSAQVVSVERGPRRRAGS